MTVHSPVPNHPPRLIFSLLILAAALIVSLVFARAFKDGTAPFADPALCGDPAPLDINNGQKADAHDTHGKKISKPPYYVGGLWSPEHGLAPLLDAAMSLAATERPIVCQSINFNADTLTVIDRSPIRLDSSSVDDDAKPDLVLSIDLAGRVTSTEYAGIGPIQQYITDVKKDYNRVLIVEPLPGPVADPDQDWGILNFDADKAVAFFTPAPKSSPERVALALFKQLGGSASASTDIDKLLEQLGSDDRTASIKARLQLATLNPYEVIPALNQWFAAAENGSRERRLFEALMVRRGLGVHADALIKEAAASENAQLRALAARSIGELADVTTDPIGKLTPLAEDDAMAVRYEALVATRAIPGRRASGVAELVEPYEMSDAMRSTYQGIMADLLTYGQPIAADSKASRLRRMSINELLKEDRNALVCTILLERTDLPDDKIMEVLNQLADATNTNPTDALIKLLSNMNPKTVNQREALLRALIEQNNDALKAQADALLGLTADDYTPLLRSAAAAAIIRVLGTDAVEKIGLRPVLFEAFAWLDAPTLIKQLAPMIIKTALGQNQADTATRVAALDAIKRLPVDSVTADNGSMLLGLATEEDDIELRFAAIRAVMALPASVKPEGTEELTLTTLTIASVPGQMKYNKDKLTVTAGRPVELTLTNPDTMEHNLVVTLPGRAQEIGIAMSADPTAAAAIGYVPGNNPAILHHTKMIPAGGSDTLRFIAPTKPGQYEYVCTFPGHYTSMRGVLDVVAP